jgi:DHA1 family tetracycline resistance protein-like MFS transporter
MTSLPQPGRPPAGAPGQRQAAFVFIFISAITTAMSFGLMIPILPNLLKQFTGGDTAQATDWNVLFSTIGGLMSFFAGPVLGVLSDRFGRRPVLLVSLAGLGADFLFMAFAPSLLWLLAGRMISGATSGAFSTANAYVADVAKPQDRARLFGLIGSAFSFGFVAGPALGGLLGEISLRAPFIAAAALTLANALYGYFIVPESLPPERRTDRFELGKANPLGSLTLLRSHRDLFGLAGIFFLNQLAQMIWPAIFVLYTGYRYHWSPLTVGVYMMAGGLIGVGVQSFLVAPCVRRFGERGTLLIGLGFATAAFAYYSWAPTGLFYLLGMPFSSLSGLITPGLQGLMTRHVGPSEQGQLQGANQSMGGIASLVGPSVFGFSFAWAVRNPQLHVPGVSLAIAAAITGLCLLLTFRTPKASAVGIAAVRVASVDR